MRKDYSYENVLIECKNTVQLISDLTGISLDELPETRDFKIIMDYISDLVTRNEEVYKLKVLMEILKRSLTVEHRDSIYDAKDAVEYLKKHLIFSTQEEVYAIYLDEYYRILSCSMIARGTYDEVIFDVYDVLKKAIYCRSKRILVVHNHPQGLSNPSKADYKTTKLIEEACLTLGITLQDSIIMGESDFFSFKEKIWLKDMLAI